MKAVFHPRRGVEFGDGVELVLFPNSLRDQIEQVVPDHGVGFGVFFKKLFLLATGLVILLSMRYLDEERSFGGALDDDQTRVDYYNLRKNISSLYARTHVRTRTIVVLSLRSDSNLNCMWRNIKTFT